MCVTPDTCFSRSRDRVSVAVAAARVLALLLVSLFMGGLGSWWYVLCKTLSCAFGWTSGGVRSP